MQHTTFFQYICELDMTIPEHVGCELQSPVAKQDTVADPDRMYPLLQL